LITAGLLFWWVIWTVYQYGSWYEERLARTELRYKDIIEHSADAIITVDKDGIITSWNRGAERVLEWSADEIIDKPVETIIPDDILGQQELACLDYGIQLRGYNEQYETERQTKSGKRVLVQLTETAIFDDNDELVIRSQILRDLTDIKLKEQQIQRSERLATVGHMAAGVAHEVGNPLAAISSLVQLVQRRSKEPFTQNQLSKVREHIDRITKIVRDLVDFSRPSGSERKRTNINKLVRSAVGLLKHDARCRDIQFNLDLASDLPAVKAVPDQIHQVLVNILLNAVDATRDLSQPQISARTRLLNDPQRIQIQLEDNGPGIPTDVAKHIFEPFYTTKEVGEGTGLGLSVSHGIIHKHGGTIDVQTEEGEGALFFIELPIADSSFNTQASEDGPNETESDFQQA
jgi:PAS domain S-box-containing protein